MLQTTNNSKYIGSCLPLSALDCNVIDGVLHCPQEKTKVNKKRIKYAESSINNVPRMSEKSKNLNFSCCFNLAEGKGHLGLDVQQKYQYCQQTVHSKNKNKNGYHNQQSWRSNKNNRMENHSFYQTSKIANEKVHHNHSKTEFSTNGMTNWNSQTQKILNRNQKQQNFSVPVHLCFSCRHQIVPLTFTSLSSYYKQINQLIYQLRKSFSSTQNNEKTVKLEKIRKFRGRDELEQQESAFKIIVLSQICQAVKKRSDIPADDIKIVMEFENLLDFEIQVYTMYKMSRKGYLDIF